MITQLADRPDSRQVLRRVVLSLSGCLQLSLMILPLPIPSLLLLLLLLLALHLLHHFLHPKSLSLIFLSNELELKIFLLFFQLDLFLLLHENFHLTLLF